MSREILVPRALVAFGMRKKGSGYENSPERILNIYVARLLALFPQQGGGGGGGGHNRF